MLTILPVLDRPDDLVGVENGRLSPAHLVSVHPDGRQASIDMMHHTTARKWRCLVVLAARLGIELSYTSIYRTYDQQVSLWYERMRREPSPGVKPAGAIANSRKVWQGVGWWRVTGAMCAVPGTSNHGWAGAVDMASGWGGTGAYRGYLRSLNDAEVAAIRAIVISCGFSWETQSESWHIRDVTGDVIPQTVLDFEGFTPPPPFTSRSKECTMIILDYRPGTAKWTRLVTTGTHIAHVHGTANGTFARVFNRLYGPDEAAWPVDIIDRDGLLGWLAGAKIDNGEACPPELRDDPAVVSAWVQAGGTA